MALRANPCVAKKIGLGISLWQQLCLDSAANVLHKRALVHSAEIVRGSYFSDRVSSGTVCLELLDTSVVTSELTLESNRGHSSTGSSLEAITCRWGIGD